MALGKIPNYKCNVANPSAFRMEHVGGQCTQSGSSRRPDEIVVKVELLRLRLPFDSSFWLHGHRD